MRYTALVPYKAVLSPLIIKLLHPLRYIMKLHLPKSLLLSLLSALTLSAPLAVTLGSTAWGGSWNASTTEEYNFTGTDDATELNTEGHVGSNGTFVKANAPNLNITLTKITQVSDTKLTITGTWNNSANSFNVLTVEELSMGDGSGSGALTIADDFGATLTTQRIKIEKISGEVTNLIVDTYGVLQLGAESGANTFTIKEGTIESGGELHLIGGTYNITGLSNSGTVVMNEGSADVVLNNLVDKTSGKYNPSVISNTSTGNLVIKNTGNKTLNGDITIANGGTVTLRGGTFGTSDAGLSNTIKTEADTFLGFEDISVNIGGSANNNQMLDADIIVGNGATLTMTVGDRYHYANKHTLKVLSGGSVVLGDTRQTLAEGFIVELAGGTITGAGDSEGMALDFYNGGTIKVTENSTLDANTGGHDNDATITLDVANGKTLTMNGSLVDTAVTVSNDGIVIYKGAVFTRDLAINKGVFEYNTDTEKTHTGNITGTGTLRKSGGGTLNLSSANTSVSNFAVTGGKLVYTVADGEKTHTLSGTGGTFEKTGAGTLNLGALKDYAYTGSLTVTEGNVKFAGTVGTTDNDEDAENVPSFVTLITHLTTVNDAKVEITDNVLFNYQSTVAADSVINIDDNITITGNLEINSHESTNAPDNDGMRRWNVLEGANLNVGGLLWLTNDQKMVVSGGNVTAAGGIKLGHKDNNADGDHHSKIVIESGTVTTTGVTFNAGENDVVMSGGELTFAPTADGAQVLNDGSGTNRFTVTGGTLKATDKSWALTGTSTHVVSLGNATFDIAADKTITLSGTMALTGALVVEGDGMLQVGATTWNVASSDLGNFSMHGVVNDETQTNGIGSRYYSFITGNVVQQENTVGTVVVDGTNATLMQNDGAWSFGGISQNDFIINGTFSTADATSENGAVEAGVFVVNKEGVFTVAGDIANGKTVTQLLTTTLGSGEILLTTNTTLDGGDNMIFGGTLAIADGTTLNVGNEESDVIDLSTLQEIRLDGGTIRYQANAGNVKYLNVTADSLLHIYDMNSATMNVDKVAVAQNATLTVNSLENNNNNIAWNHQLNIDVLTGDGSAVFNGPGDPTGGDKKEGDISSLTINSLKGFTGDLTVSSREETGDKKRYNVTIKTGADGANFNTLNLTGFNTQSYNTFVVEGNTSVNTLKAANGIMNINEGVVLTLGDGTTETTHNIGTVSTTGNGTIHLNNGATLNAFTKGEGSGTITLTGSGVYDLGNAQTTYDTGSTNNQNVNGSGNFTLASGWIGTVRIEGAAHRTNKLGLNLNNLSNANSAVELINVNGWFTDTMAGKLILTEDEAKNAAWTISNGSSEKEGTSKIMSTFNGAVSGNGVMKYEWSVAQENKATYTGFKFNGDISDWEGAFVMDVDNSLTNFNFVLGTSASEVNAAIDKSEYNKGKLHLKVERTNTTTFNNTVEVDTLTTSGGAVHFNEDVTVEETVTAGGTLHVEDGTFVARGTLNAAGKTVELSGSYSNNTGTEGKSTAKLRLEGAGNKVGTFDFGKTGYARGVLELGAESDTTAGALYMNKDVSISMEKGAELTVDMSTAATETATATTKLTSMTAVGDSAGISIDNDADPGNTRGQFTHENATKYVLSGMDVAINYSNELTSKYRYNNSSVSNIGSAKLTLDNAANALTGLKAINGNIDVWNKESMSLQELKVATSLTVGAYTGAGTDSGKTGITVMECVEFGASATLNANLTVGTGTTVTLNGYGETAAMVDGSMTLYSGLTLGGSVLDALDALQNGDSLAIFKEVSSMMFADNTTEVAVMTLSESALTEVDASIYFTNLAAGNYLLVYNEVEQTVSIQATIPEPTTATLSLLALAALAARRRRASR